MDARRPPEEPARLRSPRSERHDAIVVGGGAAGVLAAIHLLRTTVGRVTIVEQTTQFGHGIAYATTDPSHLLNVPAGRLSVDSDAPDDFTRWLAPHLPGATAATFAPRALYGRYLSESLNRADAQSRLVRRHSEAVALVPTVDGVLLELADGGQLTAGAAILATGYPRPCDPGLVADARSAGGTYVAEPWTPGSLDHIDRGDVVIAGGGLTAVDVVLTLSHRRTNVTIVSRHGLLPQSHAPGPVSPQALDSLPVNLRDLVRTVRRAATESNDWRSVIDGLRPSTQRLWQNLSVDEQEQFMRHVAPYWNVHRHRMAPQVAERLQSLISAGRVTVIAGTVVKNDGRTTEVRLRAGGSVSLRTDYIVNCTGPERSFVTRPSALVGSLLAAGLAKPDAHRIGLATTDEGMLVDAAGRASTPIMAIGAIRRGTLWESTAIPELRSQAERLPQLLDARRAA